MLTLLDFDFLKLGKVGVDISESKSRGLGQSKIAPASLVAPPATNKLELDTPEEIYA